jgi:hypothetical protein
MKLRNGFEGFGIERIGKSADLNGSLPAGAEASPRTNKLLNLTRLAP